MKERNNWKETLLVLFLITGGMSYGANPNTETITGENGIYSENSVDGIKNEGIIHGSISESKDASGNGILIYNDQDELTIGEIANDGTISGRGVEGTISGNGISTIAKIKDGNIVNRGVITGQASSGSLSGNGINSYIGLDAEFTGVTNSGVIQGAIKDSTTVAGSGSGTGIVLENVKNFQNQGEISGYAVNVPTKDGVTSAGNGIYLYKGGVPAATANNSGIIAGYANELSSTGTAGGEVGNGAVLFFVDFVNTGVVQGTASGGTRAGNGINYAGGTGGNLTLINDGVISGNLTGTENSTGSGNGVYANYDSIIKNSGIISGVAPTTAGTESGYPIVADQYQDLFANLKNDGIMIGKNMKSIFDQYYTKYLGDIYNGIILDENKNLVAFTGDARTSYDGRQIQNFSRGNEYFLSGKVQNKIINSIGNGVRVDEKGTVMENCTVNGLATAVTVKSTNDITVKNSRLNSLGTAVVLNSDSSLNAEDITLNGLDYSIQGNEGDNTATISGNSTINGAVSLGRGIDTLTLSGDVQVNADLDGGEGNEDTLNLVNTTDQRIFHKIERFESINTSGKTTLYESAKISGANINIQSGDLILRVDPTVTDNNGRILGHALFDGNNTVSSSGGNLVIGLNGIGKDSIIGMNNVAIQPEIDDTFGEESDHLVTNSSVLDAQLLENGDVLITVAENLPVISDENPADNQPADDLVAITVPSTTTTPETTTAPDNNKNTGEVEPTKVQAVSADPELYGKLNKVYASIVSAEEIGKLANTTSLDDKSRAESINALVDFLDQIYKYNPYSYTLKASRDSMKLFEDEMSYLTIKPKKGETIVQGKAVYSGVRSDSSYKDSKMTTNIVGGLGTVEYGIDDATSIGFVIGGNHQSTSFKGASKIKGNSLYVGTFGKYYVDDFKFRAGIGYQYSSNDVDRKVYNKYDYFSTSKEYDVNGLNIFLEGKYSYQLPKNWAVEPKLKFSYFYVDQKGINEGYKPGQLNMKVDRASSNTLDIEVGADIVKTVYLDSGKLKNIFSASVINTVGERDRGLSGYICGETKMGTQFDIKGTKIPTTAGKVSYNVEFEQTNGMIYNAGVSYEFAKDNNKNVSVVLGVGYKF